VLISPSILSADFTKLGDSLRQLDTGGADWIHIDVMDGHFAPNISMGPFIVEHCKQVSPLPLDVHLMISDPDRYLEDFINAGADWLTVHFEACPHIYRTLQRIKELGCNPGVALNPGTPVENLDCVLEIVDLVLVLGTNPGFSGQTFIPGMLDKIKKLKNLLAENGSYSLVEVDGGVNGSTILSIVEAGADVIVSGSAIFNHEQGIYQGIHALRDIVAESDLARSLPS